MCQNGFGRSFPRRTHAGALSCPQPPAFTLAPRSCTTKPSGLSYNKYVRVAARGALAVAVLAPLSHLLLAVVVPPPPLTLNSFARQSGCARARLLANGSNIKWGGLAPRHCQLCFPTPTCKHLRARIRARTKGVLARRNRGEPSSRRQLAINSEKSSVR